MKRKRVLEIWYIPFNERVADSTCLNEDERKKADVFVKNSDKNAYTISHFYLRNILSFYFPQTQADAWEFEFNEYGKPSLKDKENFHFNLSHSHSCAYLICSNTPCGIDIEEVRDLELSSGLVEMVLCEIELKEFQSTSNKEEYFYKHWTLKEAYLKALGLGIAKEPMNTLNIKEKVSTNLLKHEIFKDKRHLSICLLNRANHTDIRYRTLKDLDATKQ